MKAIPPTLPILALLLVGAASPMDSPLATSSWVYVGSSHRLEYKEDARGNRILDFSSAGYRGGGIALPNVPVVSTVAPTSGDATAAIQAAIDEVAKAAPNADGLRGAVLLAPGAYDVAGTVHLNASGVVLRGSGSAKGGTVLTMSGSPHLLFSIAGAGARRKGAAVAMTDSYVPSGATSFHVSDGSRFQKGDNVIIGRPVTEAWIHLMGMDALTRDGAAQTWLSAGTVIETDRVVASIAGNTITLDAPLADSFDSAYLTPPGGTISTYTFPGRISEVGVEHLAVVAPAVDVVISSPQFTGVELQAVADAWLADIAFRDTQNTVTVDDAVKHVTIDNVHVTHTIAHTGDRMADFGLSGTQILLKQCSSDGTGEWPLVTQAEVSGPIVALEFTSTQQAGIGPHQRWAVGLLADNASLPNAPNNYDGGATGISFSDRGNHGSGQGWAMGWGVAWNVTTPHLVVQQPPGAQNWCIGCVGTATTAPEAGSGKAVPNGIFESLGTKVTPRSLYLAQLCDRLGAAALINIGYTSSDCAVAPPVPSGGDAGGSTGPSGGPGAPGVPAAGSTGAATPNADANESGGCTVPRMPAEDAGMEAGFGVFVLAVALGRRRQGRAWRTALQRETRNAPREDEKMKERLQRNGTA